MNTRTFRFFIFLIMIVALFSTNACKKKPKLVPEVQLQNAVTETAVTVVYLGDKIHRRAIGIIGPKEGYAYDGDWWRFSLELWNNDHADTQFRFLDAAGQQLEFFNKNTDHILSRCQYKSTNLSFDRVRFTFSQVPKSFEYYVVNGEGDLKAQNLDTNFQVKQMNITKRSEEETGARFPVSGELIITITKIPFKILFTGNDSVKANYTYKGKNKEFTFSLIPPLMNKEK